MQKKKAFIFLDKCQLNKKSIHFSRRHLSLDTPAVGTLWSGQWAPDDRHSTTALEISLWGLAAGSDDSKEALLLETS